MSVGPGFREVDLYLTLESCLSQTIKADVFVCFDGVSVSERSH